METFLAVLPRGLYILSFAISTFLRFYVNTCTSQNQDQGAPWWQASGVVLGFSVAAFLLGAAFLLVDIGLEWNRRDRERDRQARRTELEDGFFACLAAHQIEASAAAAKRLSAAVVLLQQGEGV